MMFVKSKSIPVREMWQVLYVISALIEEGYHSTNPYHNSIHATDVTQAMHCFLQEEKVGSSADVKTYESLTDVICLQIRKHITPLEVMASLLGAVTHDLDHPGVNQHFLISTSNHLAMLYDVSIIYICVYRYMYIFPNIYLSSFL